MKIIKGFRKTALSVALLALPGLVLGVAEFGEYEKTEFSPARGEAFDIPVQLQEEADVKIDLYTANGDKVRTLVTEKPLKKGKHSLAWDGKDDKGRVVPDEVYTPVLETKIKDGKVNVVDPRTTSGGEVVDDLNVQITADRHIAYTLPAPSRVLVRAGIKSGPMMRSLANWAPRSAGKNVQRWDGFDQSRLIDLRDEKNLAVLVTAFQLPDYAIITLGNTAQYYADYRKENGWPDRKIAPDDMMLSRGEARISRQYYASPTHAADPRVQLSFSDEHNDNADGLPVLKPGQALRVKVDVDRADRWLIDESLYEVAFFVDHQFVSEEEQGYVPLTWVWTVDQLPPGQHVFTVNISGFGGKVGVASKLFEIANK